MADLPLLSRGCHVPTSEAGRLSDAMNWGRTLLIFMHKLLSNFQYFQVEAKLDYQDVA